MCTRLFGTCYLCFLLFTGAAAISFSANAQQDTSHHGNAQAVELYSPYTSISVTPGQTINYSISIINHSNSTKNVGLEADGIPRNWTHTLKSGGFDISRISVLPKKQENASLQLMVPLRVNRGYYHFTVRAGGYTTLPLTVIVSKQGTYKTDFSTAQANLEGASSTTFTFNAKLVNETADTALYALESQAPPGWMVAFKVNYSNQVASVNVAPNQTENITITVNAPDQVKAGTYQIPVFATTGSTTAGLNLSVVITGSYAMELSTPTGLLSSHITAGGEKDIALVVKNTGSAPLKNISLSSQTPADWSVAFSPAKIDEIEPGATSQVTAEVKASKEAIAGDYATTLTATTPETSSHTDFRISVRTSMLWGWIGVIIILLALLSVYYLFRKYGRR
ncbi:MAG: hypothetical protein EPN37_03055 [Chitinophagaceae bacterium]|nr:MAG: hypothetical protein EPN37_03055 [Chitinophagaceae bacterium]